MKEEVKKYGNGFRFRFAQAVIYTLSAIALIVLAIVMVSKVESSLMNVLIEKGSRYCSVTDFAIADGYDDEGRLFLSDGYGEWKGVPYLLIRYDDAADGSSEYRYDYFDFVSENVSDKTIIFANRVSGDRLTVTYSQIEDSEDILYEYNYGYQFSFKLFVISGGIIAFFALLQWVTTFVGKKSVGANNLGIVLNVLTTIVYGYGIFGLVGCIKGRMVLQFAAYSRCAAPLAEREGANTDGDSTRDEASAEDGNAYAAEDANEERVKATQSISPSAFRLDLYDANIDEKTWKQFKKTATQDELAVIAIGAKYRLVHSRIKNILYAIGIVLSIAIFWPTGGWSLIGYPVFAFLATKSIRYSDTYTQTYHRLDKEYKARVNSYYKNNIWLSVMDQVIQLAVFWITIPYQAILLLIGSFAPNFVIAKNGILVSVPQGYDVGGLGAVGEYYAQFKLIDEALANSHGSSMANTEKDSADRYYDKKEYTYTDQYGYEQTVYSDNEKDFYDVGGKYVGSAGEKGKFKKKD